MSALRNLSLLRASRSSLPRNGRLVYCARRQLSTPPASKQEPLVSSTPSLAQIIDDSIVATGPMTVARYMQLCLTHPTQGYYAQGDVFGKEGDFITSPEISQVFGELVAIWFMTRWMAAGSPEKCRIVELGPGRGTLMDDVLRTFKSLRQVSVDEVYLVENSLKMRELQKEKLGGLAQGLGAELHWSNDIDGVPKSDKFTMVVAHEFFDAMPIHILQRTTDGFREVRVDRNPSYIPAAKNPRFILAMDRQPSMLSSLLPASSKRFSALPDGTRLEISPDSSKIVRSIGELVKDGGAALVVDYGGDRSFASSFRAFRKHKIVDIFDEPGSSDLTANVDFAYLKESLGGVAVGLGPIPQSKFLLSLGLEPRLTKLLQGAKGDEAKFDRIRQGVKRLIDPLGMGNQYQVMGIVDDQAAKGDVYPFPEPSKGPGVEDKPSNEASKEETKQSEEEPTASSKADNQ